MHPGGQAAGVPAVRCCRSLWLVYGAFTDGLGANPAEYLIRATGDWTLRFICIVLAVTPLARDDRHCRRWRVFAACSGLFAYFYVVLHLLSYSWFDMGFDVGDIAKDIAKRPFILVGFSGFVLADAAGRDLVQPRDQGAGRQALAGAAQAGLRDRRAGPAALLLDARGQEQLCRSVRLRRRSSRVLLGWRVWRFASKRKAKPAAIGCCDRGRRSRCAPRTVSKRALSRSVSAAGLRGSRGGESAWLAPLTSTSAARPRVL